MAVHLPPPTRDDPRLPPRGQHRAPATLPVWVLPVMTCTHMIDVCLSVCVSVYPTAGRLWGGGKEPART